MKSWNPQSIKCLVSLQIVPVCSMLNTTFTCESLVWLSTLTAAVWLPAPGAPLAGTSDGIITLVSLGGPTSNTSRGKSASWQTFNPTQIHLVLNVQQRQIHTELPPNLLHFANAIASLRFVKLCIKLPGQNSPDKAEILGRKGGFLDGMLALGVAVTCKV